MEIRGPLVIGFGVVLLTMLVHAATVVAIVRFSRRAVGVARVRAGDFLAGTAVFAVVLFLALVSHLAQIAIWALVFQRLGEFNDFATAVYHSAVNYTTLGYGDIVMSPRWRLLGPFEAADGVLMFGASTALLFSVLQRLLHYRYEREANDS